jgi:hypothetical protein
MSIAGDHSDHWPPNQWHPAYDSIKAWLENEAPVASPLVIQALGSQRNVKPRFRLIRRKK